MARSSKGLLEFGLEQLGRQRLPDLLHSYLTSLAIRRTMLLVENLPDVVHDFLHLGVIHRVERLQNSQFSQRFHLRSGYYK